MHSVLPQVVEGSRVFAKIENFETAVRRYAEQHGIRAEAPPTEYDSAPGAVIAPSTP